MLRAYELRLRVGEPESAIPQKLSRKLGLNKLGCAVTHWQIVRESVDARDKKDIRFVYMVDFTVTPDREREIAERLSGRAGLRVERVSDERYAQEKSTDGRSFIVSPALIDERRAANVRDSARSARGSVAPVVVGFGPCGLFAALILAEHGLCPTVIERGKPVDARVRDVEAFRREGRLDTESNVQFGEGGAGTFSDGKLTTGTGDPRKEKVLRTLAAAGADGDILRKQRPHVGTDVLREVVRNLRGEITARGGRVLFGHRLTALRRSGDGLSVIEVETPAGTTEFPVSEMVLATGHSARDTFEMLYESGLNMVPKPFSIGLRIEHPQALIDAAQYGEDFRALYGSEPRAAGLPPAEYKLACRCADGRGLYTFCMCPGGTVIAAASELGGTVTNGMSERARAGVFANAALLAEVGVADFGSAHPLAGIAFQRRYERLAYEIGGPDYRPPTETVADFMRTDSRLSACLPDFAVRDIREALPRFGRKLRGFDTGEARLYGVETRSSSPVTIPRDEAGRAYAANGTRIEGLYPGGEGAGRAGGIMSAAVDGIRIAEAILASREAGA